MIGHPFGWVYVYYGTGDGGKVKLYAGKTLRTFEQRDREHRKLDWHWYPLVQQELTEITPCATSAGLWAAENEALRPFRGVFNIQSRSNHRVGLTRSRLDLPPALAARAYATGCLDTVTMLDYERQREAARLDAANPSTDPDVTAVHMALIEMTNDDPTAMHHDYMIAHKITRRIKDKTERKRASDTAIQLIRQLANDPDSPVTAYTSPPIPGTGWTETLYLLSV